MDTPSCARPRKTALIKARCEPELRQFYGRLASVRRLDFADVVRIALWEYAERNESVLPCPSTH